jgi:PKD repeat protein
MSSRPVRLAHYVWAVLLLSVAVSLRLSAEDAPTAVITGPAAVNYGKGFVVSGAGSVAASGRRLVQYIWRLDDGNPIVTAVPTLTFNWDPAHPFTVGPHDVELVVRDDFGDSSAPQVHRVIVRDTVAPTAVLSVPSTVAVGSNVIAVGAKSSDVGGHVVSYEWQLDGGTAVETATSSFTFLASDPAHPLTLGVHVVRLVVTDDAGNESAPDSESFVVRDTLAPIAVVSAPALVPFGADIPVSGEESIDVGGDIVAYQWRLDGGPVIALNDPGFTFAFNPASPFAKGSHLVQLTVVDDSGNASTPVSALIQVVDAAVPTAVLDAPATASAGVGFIVSGERSVDFDGEIVTWVWTVDAQPPVATADDTFAVPGGLSLGVHNVKLAVRDDDGNQSAPVSATVRVLDRSAPTAIIDAPALVAFEADITASGARSADTGGRIIEYSWRLDGGSPLVLPVPGVTFDVSPAAPLAPGPHVLELVVKDDSGNESDPATAFVRVTDGVAPTAILDAPATVPFGQDVEVSGARSADLGGELTRFVWQLDDQDAVETPDATHTFIVDPSAPLAIGRHRVRLVVGDDSGNESVPDEAEFLVVDSVAPTAVITAPATIVVGNALNVSGADSSDIGGEVRRYVWRLDGGSQIDQDTPERTFGAALALGAHTIELIVTDDSGNESAPATVRVDVVPPPDTVPPVVVITTPADGAAYPVGATVVASFECSDADSGIASCIGAVSNGAAIDTSSVGPKHFTVTATDVAGHVTTRTHSYNVVYGFTGFFEPVDNLPVVNAGTAGRTFPLKWRLATANGTKVTALSAVTSINDAAIACDEAPSDLLEEQLASAPGAALHYDAVADQFVYNWKTSKAMVGCRVLQVTLADGTHHAAKFRLR